MLISLICLGTESMAGKMINSDKLLSTLDLIPLLMAPAFLGKD
jgi:hypothetical protein